MSKHTDTILPTDRETHMARQTSKKLISLDALEEETSLHVRVGDQEEDLPLPSSMVRIVFHLLEEMGKGNGVRVSLVQKEFTTQQAADFLMVSRPYLIEELLEKGIIPYRKVGNRRRIRYEDLLRFQEAEEQEIARREQVMRELMEETERLGLYK